MKQLRYTHPAAMKYSLVKVYELEELEKEIGLEMIQILFTPINFKWEDLESKKPKKLEKHVVDEIIDNE